jgi:hypothetical protein
MFILQSASPAGSPWESSTINATPAYLLLSLAFNVTLSLAIVFRLLHFRRRTYALRQHLRSDAGIQCVSIAAMLIESAMLFTAVSLFTIIPMILEHPIQYVFCIGYGHTQVCRPCSLGGRLGIKTTFNDNSLIDYFVPPDHFPSSVG